MSTIGQNAEAVDQRQDVISAAPFELDFDLARNTAYHRSEMQFYLLVSGALYVVACAALCISAASWWAALPTSTLPLLTLSLSIFVILDRRVQFDRRKESHYQKMLRYLAWRALHNANRTDPLSVTTIRKEMEQEWSEVSSERYVVHFGVDAIAYNEALVQLYPEGPLRRSYMLQILWWERLAAHILPLSRERFVRRREYLNEPISLNFGIGIFWILVACGLCITGLVLHRELASFSRMGSYAVQIFLASAAFLIVDASYHRIKSAVYTRHGRLRETTLHEV
jgi:hypothetical protein